MHLILFQLIKKKKIFRIKYRFELVFVEMLLVLQTVLVATVGGIAAGLVSAAETGSLEVTWAGAMTVTRGVARAGVADVRNRRSGVGLPGSSSSIGSMVNWSGWSGVGGGWSGVAGGRWGVGGSWSGVRDSWSGIAGGRSGVGRSSSAISFMGDGRSKILPGGSSHWSGIARVGGSWSRIGATGSSEKGIGGTRWRSTGVGGSWCGIALGRCQILPGRSSHGSRVAPMRGSRSGVGGSRGVRGHGSGIWSMGSGARGVGSQGGSRSRVRSVGSTSRGVRAMRSRSRGVGSNRSRVGSMGGSSRGVRSMGGRRSGVGDGGSSPSISGSRRRGVGTGGAAGRRTVPALGAHLGRQVGIAQWHHRSHEGHSQKQSKSKGILQNREWSLSPRKWWVIPLLVNSPSHLPLLLFSISLSTAVPTPQEADGALWADTRGPRLL